MQLTFKTSTVITLGSPLAVVLAIKGMRPSTSFRIPGVPEFFNFFHPNDPIAYRMEPLLQPAMLKLPPCSVNNTQTVHVAPLPIAVSSGLFSLTEWLYPTPPAIVPAASTPAPPENEEPTSSRSFLGVLPPPLSSTGARLVLDAGGARRPRVCHDVSEAWT